MDRKPWPRGALTLAWMPEQDVGGKTETQRRTPHPRQNLHLTASRACVQWPQSLPRTGRYWALTNPAAR
ncbi:hypothetical protein ACNKHO_20555 [Shigella flexneri]